MNRLARLAVAVDAADLPFEIRLRKAVPRAPLLLPRARGRNLNNDAIFACLVLVGVELGKSDASYALHPACVRVDSH